LANLIKIDSLKHTFIIAGNHDSVSGLTSSKEFLSFENIEVIGSSIDKEIFLIENLGVIVAIPFLRDSDIKKFVSGETFSERFQQIREGIKNHYQQSYEKAKKIGKDLPIVATGHLTVAGVKFNNKEIYIGNLENIESDIFPNFDYIALGHIHKYQKITDNIVYSGSPIPLTFQEAKDKKYILIKDVKNGDLKPIEVPIFRKLISISGDFETIKNELFNIPKGAFIELNVQNYFLESIDMEIKNLAKKLNINILLTKYKLKDEISLDREIIDNISLSEFTPEQVFFERIKNISEDRGELIDSYQEILTLL
jgi:exonuclease SbcD